MYPEQLVIPMKAELTAKGFTELKTDDQVDKAISEEGTTLVVINSVCCCSAATAKPGVLVALKGLSKKPDHLTTGFAGLDTSAVNKIREYLLPYPPSSPSIALFKDGKLVHFIKRNHIEGRSAQMIAGNLSAAFEEYCKT